MRNLFGRIVPKSLKGLVKVTPDLKAKKAELDHIRYLVRLSDEMFQFGEITVEQYREALKRLKWTQKELMREYKECRKYY